MSSFRYQLFKLFLTIGALFVISRLFYIQVARNQYYRAMAEREHSTTTEIANRRGPIFTSDSFPLVLDRPSYVLFAEPKKIMEKKKTAFLLAEILTLPKSSQTSQSADSKALEATLELNLDWVALVKRLSLSTKEAISKLTLPGIGFEEEYIRYYPEGVMASYVLGFSGFNDRGEQQGYYGLEGYYNGELRGRVGRVTEETAASGRPIVIGDYRWTSAQDGATLQLTMNRGLQFLLETKTAEGVARYGARSATAILLDSASGAVLGMASAPNYNPDNYGEVFKKTAKTQEGSISDPIGFHNPAIAETYEPGSVIKGLTMSAAIETETVKPSTTFEDKGPLLVAGHSVNNWDGKHHGTQTMIELLQKSNNIGAATVGQWLGTKVLRDYFTKFGLGALTGIDLEGEALGILKNEKDWGEIDLVTAAFGQGLSATPLQVVNAYAAIANGGNLLKPFIVSRISDKEGVHTLKSTKIRRVLSTETAATMREMLTAAAEGGEAKFAILKKYKVAGKTGTAQIPVQGHYDANRTNATFVGFLTNSPQYVLLVKITEPTTSVYAAETAAPLWMEIMRDLAVIERIPPDR